MVVTDVDARDYIASLGGFHKHRPPERTCQVPHIGNALGDCRAGAFPRHRQRHAPRHCVGDPLAVLGPDNHAPIFREYELQFTMMVRAVGIEPTLLSEPDFESGIKSRKFL
jgi:hypothetical protein